jgi:hypothetical protein
MTIAWFFVWLIANLIGDHEALRFDPLNWWAATPILAIALENQPAAGHRAGEMRRARRKQ